MTTATLDQEEQAQIDAIRARKAKERERQQKLDQLQANVAAAEAALVELESKKTFLQQRKSQLENQLLTLWPRQPSDVSLQPSSSPIQLVVESHGTILGIDAALGDVPRAKKHLDQLLHVAKQKLAEFTRQK
jgi:chromosome segregation ATPase